MDKFALWSKKVIDYQRTGVMRKGQAWMTALGDVDMPLYEAWTGKKWDCFYDDSKCDAFMNELMSAWSA
jgi:uncharacterized protein YcgI (DUF1989 family)